MGIVSRNTLKTYFETGDQPTEAQFVDLIDSFLSKEYEGGVESVSELLSINTSDVNDGDTIYVLAFYDNSSIGGGIFYWDATEDKANHNGGSIIDPDHSVSPGQSGWWNDENIGSGCWIADISLNVPASMFGISTSNTGTINTSAIQAAFVDAYNKRIPLLIDVGDCDFAGNVLEAKDSVFSSSFGPKVHIKGLGDLSVVNHKPNNKSDHFISIENQHRFVIEGLYISGDNSGNGVGINLGIDDPISAARGRIQDVQIQGEDIGITYGNGFIADFISIIVNNNVTDGIRLEQISGKEVNAINIIGGMIEGNGQYGLYVDAEQSIAVYGTTIEANDAANVKITGATKNFAMFGGYMEGDSGVPNIEVGTESGDDVYSVQFHNVNLVSFDNPITFDRVTRVDFKNNRLSISGLGNVVITENCGDFDSDMLHYSPESNSFFGQVIVHELPQRIADPFFWTDLTEIDSADLGSTFIELDKGGRFTIDLVEDDGTGITEFSSYLSGTRAIKMVASTNSGSRMRISINRFNNDPNYFDDFKSDHIVFAPTMNFPTGANTIYVKAFVRWFDGSTVQSETVVDSSRPAGTFDELRDEWFTGFINIPLADVRNMAGFQYINDVYVEFWPTTGAGTSDDVIVLDSFSIYDGKFPVQEHTLNRKGRMNPRRFRPRELDARVVAVDDTLNLFGTGNIAQQSALGKLNQNISASYTESEVQDISDKVDAIIDILGSSNGFGFTSD